MQSIDQKDLVHKIQTISLPDLKTWLPEDDFDGSIYQNITGGISIVCRSSCAGH